MVVWDGAFDGGMGWWYGMVIWDSGMGWWYEVVLWDGGMLW